MRTWTQQKAGLTRALNTREPARVVAETKKAIAEWGNAWPDDWSRWQRALDDVHPWHARVDIDDLAAEVARSNA